MPFAELGAGDVMDQPGWGGPAGPPCRQLPGCDIRGSPARDRAVRLAAETSSYRRMNETENIPILLEI